MAFTTQIDNEAERIYLELDGTTKKEIRKEVNILVGNLQVESSILLNNIKKFVNERPDISKKVKIQLLKNELKNLTGSFGLFESAILKQARFLSYNIQQKMYDNSIARELGYTKQTMYMWQAVFVRTCPTCIELHGTTKSMAEWDRLGHPKSYPTICDGHCRCMLLPVEAAPNRTEVRKPVLVEADRIRRTEKKRGKKYSPSYKSQIIGNLRNSEFRKTLRDLRKVKKVS